MEINFNVFMYKNLDYSQELQQNIPSIPKSLKNTTKLSQKNCKSSKCFSKICRSSFHD